MSFYTSVEYITHEHDKKPYMLNKLIYNVLPQKTTEICITMYTDT
jgi:hypothetical protein